MTAPAFDVSNSGNLPTGPKDASPRGRRSQGVTTC